MTRAELELAIRCAAVDGPTNPAVVADTLVSLRQAAVQAGWNDLARVCLTMEWSLASGFLDDHVRTGRLLAELAATDGEPGAGMFHLLQGDHFREEGREQEAAAEYEKAREAATEEGDSRIVAVAEQRLRKPRPT